MSNRKQFTPEFENAFEQWLSHPYKDLYQDTMLLNGMRDAAEFTLKWQSQQLPDIQSITLPEQDLEYIRVTYGSIGKGLTLLVKDGALEKAIGMVNRLIEEKEHTNPAIFKLKKGGKMKKLYRIIEIDTNLREYVFYDESIIKIGTHPFGGFPSLLQQFISQKDYLKYVDGELPFIKLTPKKYDEFVSHLTKV